MEYSSLKHYDGIALGSSSSIYLHVSPYHPKYDNSPEIEHAERDEYPNPHQDPPCILQLMEIRSACRALVVRTLDDD
jgi:hypothetical protein